MGSHTSACLSHLSSHYLSTDIYTVATVTLVIITSPVTFDTAVAFDTNVAFIIPLSLC
jgi:hypothetical protein